MEKEWRVIIDGYCDGFYNMAKDEALLESYVRTRIPTLRVYSWVQPFISLGYRQAVEAVVLPDVCKKNNVGFVRRMTGGSALLHYREVTYSLTCSNTDLSLPRSVKQSYKILNSFIFDFLRTLGINASFACDTLLECRLRHDALCFSACEPFDIIVGERKICGSAQRRRRDIIFQHGSLLQTFDRTLAQALFKEGALQMERQAVGLDFLLGYATDFSQLRHDFAQSFLSVFSLRRHPARDITTQEQARVDFLLREKYATRTWNEHYAKTRLAA